MGMLCQYVDGLSIGTLDSVLFATLFAAMVITKVTLTLIKRYL